MLFTRFSEYLSRLEKTSSRLEITAILSELFNETKEEEIQEVVYLSLGVLAPNHESILLNLAEKMVIKSISIAFSVDELDVVKSYKQTGDLGETALLFSTSKTSNLTVSDVFSKLIEIADLNGEGSVEAKINKMADLLNSLGGESVKFVARIPVGKLRLGFSEKTIIDALSDSSKEEALKIEESYNIRPDIGYIAKLVKENNLQNVTPKVGVPIVPMLAQRLNSTTEMIKKMEEVSVEPKFDGLRIFIHYKRSLANKVGKRDGVSKGHDFVAIFTRNMNVIDINTFPELLEVGKFIKADEAILDSEAVGIDEKREMFLDFQKTISRRRKHEVEKTSNEIPLQFQVFDCLYIDGKSLINEEYLKRREIVEKTVVNGKLLRVDENTITKDPEVIKKLHEKYLKMGLEGVVVKRANGKYVSGRTGWNWVKMKEEEGQEGRLSDTIDAIVMGYFVGKGKRAQFGLGMLLVGIKKDDQILTLTKIGTGLTEEMLVNLKKQIDIISSKDKPKEYEAMKDLVPDVWAMPKIVVEVTADSISKSTKHSTGFSLRFPRFLKIRKDKSINEATTLQELKEIANY